MYEIRIQNGKQTRKVTGYPSQDAAALDAQAMADSIEFKRGTKISVVKTPTKRKSKAKSVRRYKGHDIRSRKSGKFKYVVEPYGHKFETLAAAKRWVDGHIKRESPKVNPAPPRKTTKRKASPKRTRKNPAKRKSSSKSTKRAPLSKRLNLKAKRIDWSQATKTEIATIARVAAKKGDKVLAAKARAALKRARK